MLFLLTGDAFHAFSYLLQYDLKTESRERMEQLASEYGNHMIFLPLDLERLDAKLPRSAAWPVEVYFRLLLPELLPEDVDRILYLDSDIIINQNLGTFYGTDFEGNMLIGCRDLALLNLTVEQCLEKRSERLRPLFEEKRYINSGVLLLSIRELRRK